jgi:hypothetical protein
MYGRRPPSLGGAPLPSTFRAPSPVIDKRRSDMPEVSSVFESGAIGLPSLRGAVHGHTKQGDLDVYPPPLPVTVLQDTTSPDHIYVDGTLYNDTFLSGQTGATAGPQYVLAQIQQQQTAPIVTDTSQYNLVIARFSIGSSFVARTEQPNDTDPSNAQDWVSLSYDGVFYDAPVIIPLTLDAIGQPARLAYTIQAWLDVVNAAWAVALAAVIAANPGLTGPTAPGPVMTFDPATGLYALDVPAYFGTGVTGATAGNGIAVGMSYQLYRNFQSFNVVQSVPLLYNHHDITFVREFTGTNDAVLNFGPTGGTGEYMVLQQEAAWGSSIENTSQLLLTSTSLPIYAEYIATTSASNPNAGMGNITLATITDFLIGVDSELASQANGYLYVPTLYRIVSMKGGAPLTYWDVQVYIRQTDGTVFPLYLAPGESMSVKLLFLKKGLTA